MNPGKRQTCIFEDTALKSLTDFINHRTLFAFDLDGTLAPIVTNPGDIVIPRNIREEFNILNMQATVAVITGRSRQDAMRYFDKQPRYLIGNHGADGLPGWESQEIEFSGIAANWQRQLNLLLNFDQAFGIKVENKGATLSIHYRQSDKPAVARKHITHAVKKLIPEPRIISGKYIENLLPKEAPDKGKALLSLMNHTGCVRGFFIGDDETDEDIFRLKNDTVFTVRVGKKHGSCASFFINDQQEMVRLIKIINHITGNT